MTFRPAPKPVKPVRGTKAARSWMDLVAQLPCVCCGRYGVQVHHCIHGRFSQSKSSDLDTIPLCRMHHDMLHESTVRWCARYGLDTDHLPAVAAKIAEIKRNSI